MTITLNNRSFFIFDLDDTLFKELDFLSSAYREIANTLSPVIGSDIFQNMWDHYKNKTNVFKWILEEYSSYLPHVTVETLLKQYREHVPTLKLSEDVADFLEALANRKVPLGLITDGRSVTQRNKLKALRIEGIFNDIIISEEFGSEKPSRRNFQYFEDKYPGMEFYFIGDNTQKDFIIPSRLGWHTICVKNTGNHIHVQDLYREPLPEFFISSFKEIIII